MDFKQLRPDLKGESMVAPSIQTINPFDARQTYEASFHLLGAQSYSNEIIIRQANNLNTAYTMTIGNGSQVVPSGFQIPGGTLRNGIRYGVRARACSVLGEWSSWSTEVFFYCFSVPTLEISNIPSTNIIGSSSFTATASYTQDEGEGLQSFTFYLYDRNKVLLSSSGLLYNTQNIRHTYSSLENGSKYYLRVTGTTVHNMSCDSGFVEVNAEYVRPSSQSALYLTNYPDLGYITVRTNVSVVEYDGSDIYYYHNGWIDLRPKPLPYDGGFEINGDFTMWVKIKDCYKNNNALVKLANPQGGCVYLSSHIDPATGGIYFRVTATPSDGTTITPLDYIVYSEMQPALTDSDEVTICVRREHNIFDIKVWVNDQAPAFNIGKVWLGANSPVNGSNDVKNGEAYVNLGTNTDFVEETNYHYGYTEPEGLTDNAIWIGGE